MPQKPDHKPAGPGGGQFTFPHRPEADVALSAASSRLVLPEDGFQGRH